MKAANSWVGKLACHQCQGLRPMTFWTSFRVIMITTNKQEMASSRARAISLKILWCQRAQASQTSEPPWMSLIKQKSSGRSWISASSSFRRQTTTIMISSRSQKNRRDGSKLHLPRTTSSLSNSTEKTSKTSDCCPLPTRVSQIWKDTK